MTEPSRLFMRYLWTWDHRMEWSGKTPGRSMMGGGPEYHKSTEEFIDDYVKLIDFMHEHQSFNAIIIYGFVRDSHGGIPASQEICKYAKGKGIRIVPGIGTSWYGGFYYEGDHEFNIDTRLKNHPDMCATKADGSPWKVLCPSRSENKRWLIDACDWLYDNFDIGGLNLEVGDYSVCHCDSCVQERKLIPGKGPEHFKQNIISVVPVTKHAKEKHSDSWVSFSAYAAFDSSMKQAEPSWMDAIPKDVYCQWGVPGVDENTWPEGLKAPAELNMGLVHISNKSSYTLNEFFIERIRHVCRRGQEGGLEGIVIYGEDPGNTFPLWLAYECWKYFLHHPMATMEDFSAEGLSQYCRDSHEAGQLLDLCLNIEASGNTRSSLIDALSKAGASMEIDHNHSATWMKLVSYLEGRVAEISKDDVQVSARQLKGIGNDKTLEIKQDNIALILPDNPSARRLSFRARMDFPYFSEHIEACLRIKINGKVLTLKHALNKEAQVRVPKTGALRPSFDTEKGAWEMRFGSDFDFDPKSDDQKKMELRLVEGVEKGDEIETIDRDPYPFTPEFEFDIKGMLQKRRNTIEIENLFIRYRPSRKGILIVEALKIE